MANWMDACAADEIQCPKHVGQVSDRTGEGLGAPACINCATDPVELEDGRVFVQI